MASSLRSLGLGALLCLAACGGRQTESNDAGACNASTSPCDGVCVDLRDDPAHCGACGRVCPAGQVCGAGVCRLECPSGFTNCDGRCRNLDFDRAACGACNVACAAGLVCSKGACALHCGGGAVKCGDRCTTVDADPQNCGACGTRCPTGATCVGGVCSCPSGTTKCGEACVDTSTDRNHCGGCGVACPGTPCVSAPVGKDTRAPRCVLPKTVGLNVFHGCLVAEAGAELRPYCWGTGKHRTTSPTEVTPSPVPVAVDGVTLSALRHPLGAKYQLQVGQDLTIFAMDKGTDYAPSEGRGGLYGWGAWADYLDRFGSPVGEYIGFRYEGSLPLAAGAKHFCAARLDMMLCMGSNFDGQLGVADPLVRAAAPVPTYGGHESLSAYGNRSCTVHSGNVHCWGGDFGKVAIRLSGRSEPEVHVGASMQCLRSTTGQLSCWGSGILGDGLPARTGGPTVLTQPFEQVSIGGFGCGVSGGEIYCWGPGEKGQIGDGALVDRLVPTKVKGIATAVQVSVTDTAACAVTKEGAVYCWGENTSGRLGPLAKGAVQAEPVQLVIE